jgi:hypothetical protein
MTTAIGSRESYALLEPTLETFFDSTGGSPVAGPPLVLPVGKGVPASRARLAAIEGGSVEKSG